jgi:hypothetical protein
MYANFSGEKDGIPGNSILVVPVKSLEQQMSNGQQRQTHEFLRKQTYVSPMAKFPGLLIPTTSLFEK